MTAISGTRRSYKELADGTIRVQIDIDPSCKDEFLDSFRQIDMPIALAPLVADFEQRKPEPVERPKGGNLAKLAGQLCNNPDFMKMIGAESVGHAAVIVREACGVDSRCQLDHFPEAAQIFHEKFRIPFVEMEVRP